jgi:hypothetical protein
MHAGCVADRCRVCRSNRCTPALDVNLDAPIDVDIGTDIHARTPIEYQSDNRVTDHHPARAIHDSRADDSRLDDGAATVRAGHCAEGSYDVEAGGVQL